MWKVRVELVAPDGVATLANEYSYETSEYASRCASDVAEILAESDHVSDFEASA
jgi:hypothetical protein